jgi:transposase
VYLRGVAAKTSDKGGAGGVLQGSVIEVLRELLSDATNADQVLAVVAKLVSRNEELERLLALARERRNKGEKLAPGQLDLILDQLRGHAQGELAEANEKLEQVAAEQRGRPEPIKPPKQPPVRRPPPPGLRRVENVIPVPAAERACPKCGGERHCVGHEITETIDLIPAEVIVRQDKREVVACRPCDGEMARAPMGDKVVTGGAYGSTLVGQLVVEKYWWSKPLNRLKEDLAGLGLPMPSSKMSDQIGWAADLLLPIWRCLLATVLSAKVMHGDGTSIPVRDKDSPTGLITGTLWGWVGDQSSAVYLYTSTGKRVGQRDGEIGPEEFLALRKGYVCLDAASIFDSSFVSPERIEVGCNMHARRYFAKALDANDARAAVPLAAFQALYDVEATVRDADPACRLEERQRRSKPVYDELVEWCRKYQPFEPPGSLLGKAIQYLLNHRVALTRFLDDGVVPIARRLAASGFSLLATRGTAAHLRAAGVAVEEINKVSDGGPHIVDALRRGDVALVVNTPAGADSQRDAFQIRRTALECRVPYFTTLAAAAAAAEGIDVMRRGFTVRPLQEHHRR